MSVIELPKWILTRRRPALPEEATLRCHVTPRVNVTAYGGGYRSVNLGVNISEAVLKGVAPDLHARKAFALPLILDALEEALPILRAMVAAEVKPEGAGDE